MSLPACIAPSSTTLGCLLHVPELLHVCESKEDNALKAKLRRLCEEKKGVNSMYPNGCMMSGRTVIICS